MKYQEIKSLTVIQYAINNCVAKTFSYQKPCPKASDFVKHAKLFKHKEPLTAAIKWVFSIPQQYVKDVPAQQPLSEKHKFHHCKAEVTPKDKQCSF